MDKNISFGIDSILRYVGFVKEDLTEFEIKKKKSKALNENLQIIATKSVW